MDKTVKLPISKFIDNKFRDYAVYVLESRGIPSFYDGLTPVQRYILMNSPTSYSKTLSVVGKSIEDGYHHGNSSLESAISKLARPFGSALRILDGYGFFGTEVCPSPAAARYTSVKLSPDSNEILKKYKHLTTREDDGPYDPFWMDIPLGLTTSIVGIAVGYKTTILPRKKEDIQKYLAGEIKSLKPYFIDFKGKIKKFNNINKSWIISSDISVEGNKLNVKEIPPILKYTSALKRLDYLINKYEHKVRIVNNSNTKVNIDIVYIGRNKEEWIEIQEYINKVFSIIVTENPVFIKDNQVLTYDSIEEYLDDYRWQLKRLLYYNTLYERDFLQNELNFNEAKFKFITFILQKKRTVLEIDTFLKDFTKEVSERLERMTSKKFTSDELKNTSEKIKEIKKDLKIKEKELIKNKKDFDKEEDPTTKRGVSSKKTNSNLFDIEDVEEVNGIYIWGGADIYEDDEKDLEDEE